MVGILKLQITRHLSNLSGWLTNRKIVVFESDDWGSIRMPSIKAFEKLSNAGLDLTSGDAARYNLNDTLASKNDLANLFEILSSCSDKHGRNVVFTAISLVANPDFQKIKSANFQEYYYEPFTETLKRYNKEDAFALWTEGIQKRLFVPEFHGREHLNVQMWMRDLQNGNSHTLKAFELGLWSIKNKSPISYQAAFDLGFSSDIDYQKSVIRDGLALFNQLHGYKAIFFVPPNGPFNSGLETSAFEAGIKFISTSKIHREPQGNGQFKKKFYWLGKKNKLGQRYITRNAFFEPSKTGKDWVNSCLKDIALAFKYCKPATISTHRVNYIGSINPQNRDNGLKQLNLLLKEITKRWPDVEFMTSAELGNLIIRK